MARKYSLLQLIYIHALWCLGRKRILGDRGDNQRRFNNPTKMQNCNDNMVIEGEVRGTPPINKAMNAHLLFRILIIYRPIWIAWITNYRNAEIDRNVIRPEVLSCTFLLLNCLIILYENISCPFCGFFKNAH